MTRLKDGGVYSPTGLGNFRHLGARAHHLLLGFNVPFVGKFTMPIDGASRVYGGLGSVGFRFGRLGRSFVGNCGGTISR